MGGTADPHLNGYKIANPTILARISRGELRNYWKAAVGACSFCRRRGARTMHRLMADALDTVLGASGRFTRPHV